MLKAYLAACTLWDEVFTEKESIMDANAGTLASLVRNICKEIGADGKVRQGLIRTAKNNGGRLGFLA